MDAKQANLFSVTPIKLAPSPKHGNPKIAYELIAEHEPVSKTEITKLLGAAEAFECRGKPLKEAAHKILVYLAYHGHITCETKGRSNTYRLATMDDFYQAKEHIQSIKAERKQIIDHSHGTPMEATRQSPGVMQALPTFIKGVAVGAMIGSAVASLTLGALLLITQ